MDEFAAGAFGAKPKASGHAEAGDKASRLFAEAAVSGVDVPQLRRLTGGTLVPIAGRLDAEAVEKASLDVRRLFRKPESMVPVPLPARRL